MLTELQALGTEEFGQLVASLFRKAGYAVRPCSGDGEIGLVLSIAGHVDLARWKDWKQGAEAAVVRRFDEAIAQAGARRGFIVSVRIDADAHEAARHSRVTLIDLETLLRWVLDGSAPATVGYRGVFDPYAVLGLRRGASIDEVRHAYREEMFRHHPDRVAHLGPEMREVAEVRAREINRAYEVLTTTKSRRRA
jgi:DnaJ-domain-containing protein 1